MGLKDDRIIVKDDPETAVIDIAEEIARNRGGRSGTAMDNSRVGDSDSKRAIQDVEGQRRTIRSALQEKLKINMALRHAVTPWLI